MSLTVTPPSALITGKNIFVSSEGKTLLDNVSITVNRGDIVTIIGPNGGGKTTLVKSMLGLRPINKGSIDTHHDLTIGYVPQKLSIDRTLPLTVERLMSLTQSCSKQDMVTALEETGVAHKRTSNVHTLSGGEMQRVLLARALARKPDLMVLDEPAQGVDHVGELALYKLIEAIRDRHNCGILLVSHDLHMVMRASTHVICLNKHICCAGKPANVEKSADFQRLFGAKGIQTMVPYAHHHSHSHDPLDASMLEEGTQYCDHDHTQEGEEHHHA